MDRTGLPIELGPVSNGEYAPPPPTPLSREAARRAAASIDDGARRTSMDRRQFLRTCGTAAVLSAIAACSREQAADPTTTTSQPPTTGPATTTPGGTFRVTPEATIDPDAAAETFGDSDFVVDVQTHLLEFDLSQSSSRFFGSGFPQASCGLDDPRSCFSIDQWIALVLEGSDTALAVLSAVPIVDDPSPLSTEVMERARRAAEAAGCDGRVLIQGEAFPNVGRADAVFEGMEALAGTYDIAAWKTYTHQGAGWFLDDHDPDAPQIGQRFLDAVRRIGPPIVAVHKGLGAGPFAVPSDIGRAAADNPDITFLVYHSGYQAGGFEGPYDPAAPGPGIDQLLVSLERNAIGPGGNVYAELGSTWFRLLSDPTQAAHGLGKLLNVLGPDRILWGTDSLWYGSPQGQIDAFRTFEISAEFQERFGYPALDPSVKRKILGQNAARLHSIPEPDCVPSPAIRPTALPPAFGPANGAEAATVFRDAHPWF